MKLIFLCFLSLFSISVSQNTRHVTVGYRGVESDLYLQKQMGHRRRVKATVTNADATGPGASDGTSIMCTDITEIPSKTKTDDYFYLKINGNYKKVLFTEADSNWAGQYTRSNLFDPLKVGVVTYQSPSEKTSPVAVGTVSPITLAYAFSNGFPGAGVVDGDHLDALFPVGPPSSAPYGGTNVRGFITFNITNTTHSKIGSETPIPNTLSTGTYYAFLTNTDNTGTCLNGVLAIGLEGGEAGGENNLDVSDGDTLKLYFKSKKCGGNKCGSSGGRSKRHRRHFSDVGGNEVEVGDLAEFEEDVEDNGEDGFAQFWADKEADVNDEWEEEAEEEK